MAKAKKAPAAKMVWRIFKFFERFEYTHEAFRKKPLVFIKSFVGSGCDDISAEYFRQMQDLRLYQEYLMLKGMFADIRDISANTGLRHRGYLLDGMYQPASSKLIGSWVGIDARAAGAALKKLENVGLIEQVELPDFETMEDPQPEPKKPAGGGKKAEKKKPGKKRKKSEKKSDPLKNGKTAKRQNGKAEGETASGKTANVEAEKETALTGQGQGQSQGPQEPMPGHLPAAEAAEGAKGNATLLRAKTGEEGAVADAVGQEEEEDVSIDSKAPDEPSNAHKPPGPHKPTEADGSGSEATTDADGSPTSTEADGGASLTQRTVASGGDPPQHYDNSSEPTFEQKYSPECREFAVAIYQAIRGRHPIGSPEAYRELATFATQWSYAQESAIGDTQLGVLWGKAVMEATKLGRKRRMRSGPRSPEAVWITVFKGRLAKMVAGCGTEAIVTKAAHA